MFGKKAKKQQAEQAKQAAELRNTTVSPAIPVTPVNPVHAPVYMQPVQPEQKVFYESEVINDDEEDTVEIELLLDPATLKAKAQQQLVQQQQDMQEGPDIQNNIVGETVVVDDEDYEDEKDNAVANDTNKSNGEAQQQVPTSNIINITNTVVNPYAQQQPEEKKEEKEEKPEEPEVRYIYDGPEEDDEIVKPAKLVKLPNLVDYMLSLNMSKRMKMNVATLLLGAYAKYKSIPAEKEILIGCMKKIMYALMNEK